MIDYRNRTFFEKESIFQEHCWSHAVCMYYWFLDFQKKEASSFSPFYCSLYFASFSSRSLLKSKSKTFRITLIYILLDLQNWFQYQNKWNTFHINAVSKFELELSSRCHYILNKVNYFHVFDYDRFMTPLHRNCEKLWRRSIIIEHTEVLFLAIYIKKVSQKKEKSMIHESCAISWNNCHVVLIYWLMQRTPLSFSVYFEMKYMNELVS